jgi:hypothetical protein
MNKNYADMAMAPAPEEATTPQADPAKTDQLREDIISALEKQGVMEKLTSEQEMNEIMQLVDQLVEAMINGDQAAMQQNPLLPLIAGEPEGMAGPMQGEM